MAELASLLRRAAFPAVIGTGLALAGAAVPAAAEMPLPPFEGPVILTISGDIARPDATTPDAEARMDAGEAVELDLPMLRALGVEVVETGTIWTAGTTRFEGVPVATVLRRLDARGSTLRLTALNDYSVDIPLGEIEDHAPLLAFSMDGSQLSSRDKGPIWLVYPFDSEGRYQSEQYYARAIWQLTRLEVLP